jgi:localization factor PodJL
MTSGAPWSVKGIDPKAREIAKDLARRSGMTLGEWLNHVIQDAPETEPAAPRRRRFDTAASEQAAPPVQRIEPAGPNPDDLDRVTEALERLSARIQSGERRHTQPQPEPEAAPRAPEVLTRIEAAERAQSQAVARFEGLVDEVRTTQEQLVDRLAQLERERAGGRSAEALRSLEQALVRVAGQLSEGEGRTRDSLGVLRQEMEGLTDKVRRVESSNDPRGTAAVEQAVDRLGEQLDRAEARTSAALRSLEGSFADLDDRLRRAESQLEAGGSLEHRFEALAADLTQRVEQVRSDLSDRLAPQADPRMDRVEGALREVAGQVQAAEQRSAQAMERMGQEVGRLTDQMNQKVAQVESRSADAIGKVSGEMARIADAMERRLKRADVVQAEALEKLGSEIARITERLAERIANAERRSAQSMDDVGEQVARATERLQQRNERASSELLDRLKQSEERTARLLDEAREKIDQRLAETQKRVAQAAAPATYADPYTVSYDASAFAQQDYGGPAFASQDPDSPFAPSAYELSSATHAAPAPDADFDVRQFDDPPLIEPDFGDADVQAFVQPDEQDVAAPEAVENTLEPAEPVVAEPTSDRVEDGWSDQGEESAREDIFAAETAPETRSASTRDLIAQARAAARAASETPDKQGKRAGGGERATKSSSPLFSGFGVGRRKKPEAGALKTALMMSAAAAFLGVGASGYVLINGGSIAGWSEKSGGAPAGASDVAATTAPPAPTAETLNPNLALALGPDPAAAPAPPSPEAQALYSQAVAAIDGGDAQGLELLKRAANLGYAPAQFFLAKLYQDGKSMTAPNLQEARRWAARAAANGEPRAMHLLGTLYVNGEGGEKNAVAGYEWFKKAAELGYVDSQYNLGMMNEAGLGIGSNPSEAYKWYLIAGRAGDEEGRLRAQKLRTKLSAAERAIAEKAAQAFRADAPNPSAVAPSSFAASATPQGQVANAQRALSRLGYYQGPSDGASSPALRLAIAAFQRDQGLPVDGALTPDLLQRFAAASR